MGAQRLLFLKVGQCDVGGGDTADLKVFLVSICMTLAEGRRTNTISEITTDAGNGSSFQFLAYKRVTAHQRSAESQISEV